MQFDQLGLKAELLRAVAAQGYSTPTPVQAKTIPFVLEGRDVLAGAQTGTGKTAAFALPLLQLLSDAPKGTRAPRVLVLAPTRELAAQIGEGFRDYGRFVDLRTAVVFGGVNINPQKRALERGIDILVATPGRLLDLASQGSVDLSEIERFVLDEADRMLDMGFIRDIRKVIALLPAERQNLMFSATYDSEIRKLAERLLDTPATIEVASRNAAAQTVAQRAYRVEKAQKRHALAHLIESGQWSQVLVFTRTKHGANRLAQQLNRTGIDSAAIHGNKSQRARTEALAGFKRQDIRVLVATDIAARGLDIESLPHVVNFELPNVPEDYVHRIGRTGRAGQSGEAISLVAGDEAGLLKGIERLLGRQLDIEPAPGIEHAPAPPPQRPPERGERRDKPPAPRRRRRKGRKAPVKTAS